MVKRAQDNEPGQAPRKRTKASDSSAVVANTADINVTGPDAAGAADALPSTTDNSSNMDSGRSPAGKKGDSAAISEAVSPPKDSSSATMTEGSPSSDGPSTPECWPPHPQPQSSKLPRADATLADLPDDELRALFVGIDYVPTNVLCRLVAFTTKVDDKNRRYSVNCVPTNARWGHSGRTEKFLCVDNEPITIWSLANIETTWFFDLEGNPHGRVNVGHRLPFDGDDKGADKLFLNTNPPMTDNEVVKFAGRYMKRFEKGCNFPTILPFEAIYDATRHFKSKSEMERIPSSRVGKRDIVLLESNLTRWKEGEAKKARRWTKWKAGLELQAVSLLFEAPAGLEPEPAAPLVDDEDDDM